MKVTDPQENSGPLFLQPLPPKKIKLAAALENRETFTYLLTLSGHSLKWQLKKMK